MTARPIILDAGPALTFAAVDRHSLLVEVVAERESRLLAPETVMAEVDSKAGRDRRFAQCPKRMRYLAENGHIEVLIDDIHDDQLAHHVAKVTGVGMAVRVGQSKDLGEVMVIAHGLKLRAAGESVLVFIDEWRGQRTAAQHGLGFIGTEHVLRYAAQQGRIRTREEMRKLYERMRGYDDGLVHIDDTRLLDKSLYVVP